MSAPRRHDRPTDPSSGSARDCPPKGAPRRMFTRKILPTIAVAALGIAAATAFGHGTRTVSCPPGNTNPAYCTTTPDPPSGTTTTTDTTPTVTAPSQTPPPQGTSGNDTLSITEKP